MRFHDEKPGGVMAAIRDRAGVLMGLVGLLAWFALLWFMFGDVL